MAYGCFSRAHKYTKRRVCVSGAQASREIRQIYNAWMTVEFSLDVGVVRHRTRWNGGQSP